MKIHLPKHTVTQVQLLNNLQIPLGYIDTTDNVYTPNIKINKEYTNNSDTLVRAYQEIENGNTLFFDSNKNRISTIHLQRPTVANSRYTYVPTKATEFTPQLFNASVLIKKALSYSERKTYNITACVAETGRELTLSNNLIKIFGDANRRGLCPSNITINNGAMTPQSLLQPLLQDSDFCFMSSNDGVTLPDNFDINKILDGHINIWLSVAQFGSSLKETTQPIKEKEGHLSVFYKNSERKKNPTRIFSLTELPKQYQKEYKATLLYEDVLLLEKPNKSFLIITPQELLKDTVSNYKIIYDVLFYVFSNGYYESHAQQSWITNSPVDYQAYTYKKINQYHDQILLSNLLQNANYHIGNEYILIDVLTNRSDVIFTDMSASQELFFRKTSAAKTDPVKKENEISFLTTKNTIINYIQEDIHLIETPLKTSYYQDNGVLYLQIEPIHNSYQQLYMPTSVTLPILDPHQTYYLCMTKAHDDSESICSLVPISQYSMSKYGIQIATVSITIKDKTTAVDIRAAGGGLPIAAEDDYNMFDIGNIYGRPYRLGSTRIITLPKVCEPYKDIIQKELEKHQSSAETTILVFK